MFVTTLAFALTACGANSDDQKTAQKESKSENHAASMKTKGLVDKDKTVAVVNDEKIKGKQYNSVLKRIQMMSQLSKGKKNKKALTKQAKQQALDTLIGQTLILQDAKKKGYKPSQEKVSSQIEQIKKKYGGEKKLKQKLKKQNLTIDELKTNVAEQLQWSKYMKNEVEPVKVSEKEIKSAYEQYSKQAKKPKKLKELKPMIKKRLEQQKKQQKIAKIIGQLKQKSNIEIKI